ncbi:DUF4230 domain-containing protein [Hephaestia sp. GCM10023244]|uniref:DUF4230 domain-containing protein n=1 Tax=unclassified Hephaestia TaxID=2631281 RepID=UPI002076FE75|nr:DUF4230 domain-containing protein [Hephaestia sp. MAHUQ-44]MCM8731794.1 DUF4230 domain-containing protein [Hephaestia sp. MAHUQ-44]
MADGGVSETPVIAETPRRAGIGGFLVKFAGAIAILIVVAFGLMWAAQSYVGKKLSPNPVTIANASLQGLQEQNRLSAFAARYVAVVTSKQTRLGLTAEKTMIMPGMVRYEVDLGKLSQRDVTWDAGTNTLGVRLPAVEVDQPQIDLAAIRQYGSGGVLMTLTSAEADLDAANRQQGQAELLRQARAPTMIRIARDATRSAVERSFAMPLRAAGIDATVKVTFADEGSTERWDASRSLQEVLGEDRAKR